LEHPARSGRVMALNPICNSDFFFELMSFLHLMNNLSFLLSF